MKKIVEAPKKEFMSKRELALKKRLIALLKDDGHGHRHPKYAARLEQFDINIVYNDPDFTAAVSFDEGKIYISEGFLQDSSGKTFEQLNVLMRHELAHYLMAHQIRMMHKLTELHDKEFAEHIKFSNSLHDIINWIEDFEISNKRYTPEDKETVRNMWLNGRVIGGLITEDHRQKWASMSVEEMYDALEAEIKSINKFIIRNFEYYGEDPTQQSKPVDSISRNATDLHFYCSPKFENNFLGTVDDFMQNKCIYHLFTLDTKDKPCLLLLKSLPSQWQKIVTDVYEAYSKGSGMTEAQAQETLLDIIKSSPVSAYNVPDVKGKTVTTVYSPEEKLIVSDMIRSFLAHDAYVSDYEKWYNKVLRVMADTKYSNDDLRELFSDISK